MLINDYLIVGSENDVGKCRLEFISKLFMHVLKHYTELTDSYNLYI
jgi:hypothetical protein